MALIQEHQALDYAKTQSGFNKASLVIVDEFGNVRFDPLESEYELLKKQGQVFIVKGSITEVKEEDKNHSDNEEN